MFSSVITGMIIYPFLVFGMTFLMAALVVIAVLMLYLVVPDTILGYRYTKHEPKLPTFDELLQAAKSASEAMDTSYEATQVAFCKLQSAAGQPFASQLCSFYETVKQSRLERDALQSALSALALALHIRKQIIIEDLGCLSADLLLKECKARNYFSLAICPISEMETTAKKLAAVALTKSDQGSEKKDNDSAIIQETDKWGSRQDIG